MRIRTFRHKYRFCTNLREEDLVFLRQSAGLPDDETVCLLIDDALLMKGTKNVVFTDRRILWQEKRGRGAGVFASARASFCTVSLPQGASKKKSGNPRVSQRETR